MPGILPMKVIKVGSTSQSRIAQACDRCRSKKIRCDGIRPCCSQCANVGFECKTSDKLSRRAFPRGYTESLEERVRILEGEVRELKDLLDEKDEKIDMLSKMHSNRRPSISSSSGPPSLENKKETTSSPLKEDVFRVQASPLLLGAANSDSYFMGASSGRTFVDALKQKIQESGKSLAGFNTEIFLNNQSEKIDSSAETPLKASAAPSRMFSDRCVNVFFQEWAPLFPVLHKPTFLHLYEEYMTNPDEMTDPHKLAQLHLVFAIAGQSSDMPDREPISFCEYQWRTSLDAVLMESTLLTLQCLTLALIYCISKADYNRLQHYKGIAVGLSHRLGLHQSQKRFSFGALTIETRKKVFWSLYTVDCFSAALLGLPKLLREEDLHAEYPSDTDDEYVTEKGFQPTLPGEYTKISSALALFRLSRILSKVLGQVYPAATSHELSLQCLTSLESELNDWSEKLPSHLKLSFAQDKPSTNVTGSRSALLSLAYYYVRSLIHRPAVGSSLGEKSAPSVISLADSSKHIIQIVQLLEERSMSFSFCLNKNEMLTLCGLSLLYQGLDLKQEGKLMRDSQRLLVVVTRYLEKADAPGASDFKRLADSMLSIEPHYRPANTIPGPTNTNSSKCATSPSLPRKQLHLQLHRHASVNMSESEILSHQEKLRRSTLPNIAMRTQDSQLQGRTSTESMRSDSSISKRESRGSAPQLPAMIKPHGTKNSKRPNLDYLSLDNTPETSQPQSPRRSRPRQPSQNSNNQVFSLSGHTAPKVSTAKPSEWEVLLGSYDERHLYDAIYGGGTTPALALTDTSSSNYGALSPESWDYTTIGLDEFTSNAAPPQSVLSFSEESLSSGEELTNSDLGLPGTHHDYTRPGLPGAGSSSDIYGYILDGFEGGFNL